MYAYLTLTLPFLGFVILLDLVLLKTRVLKRRDTWVVMAIMLAFTAVFDQFFTGLPIVHYNFGLTSGIKLWHAPIEDFSYTIAAVIGIGSILAHITKRQTKS